MGWDGSIHCTRYESALPIIFGLAFSCAFIKNVNHVQVVFVFCFLSECCKHQVRKIMMLVSDSGESSNWLRKVQRLIKF